MMEWSINKIRQYPVFFQIVKYGLVGVVNTAVGLGMILSLMYFMNMGPYLANIIGYACAMIFSYVFNRVWTFQSQVSHKRGFTVFVAVVGVSFLCQLSVLHGLILSGINAYLAQIMAMIIYIIVGFVGHKFLTFKGKP